MKDLVLGTASIVSYLGNIEANLENMEIFLEQGQKEKVDLVVFPEMNITGYCSGTAICDNAIGLDDSLRKRLSELSSKFDISFLCGLAEIDGDKIFASHLFFNKGKFKGKYRKIQPGPSELEFISAGDNIPLFELKGWIFGIQICFDSHFPEISTFMAKKGADLIIIPHASPRGNQFEKLKSWERHLTARAYDNSLYVAAVNQCGDNGNLNFPGISLLISPSGEIDGKNLSQNQVMSIFKLEKNRVDEIKAHRMKNFIRYRRGSFYNKIFQNLL
ncbi:MAG: amidohydrolase [Deltaproteobacteria bacterium]|nr:MAG: amidohydrolase [Deltaproteobacteria bacterium]